MCLITLLYIAVEACLEWPADSRMPNTEGILLAINYIGRCCNVTCTLWLQQQAHSAPFSSICIVILHCQHLKGWKQHFDLKTCIRFVRDAHSCFYWLIALPIELELVLVIILCRSQREKRGCQAECCKRSNHSNCTWRLWTNREFHHNNFPCSHTRRLLETCCRACLCDETVAINPVVVVL